MKNQQPLMFNASYTDGEEQYSDELLHVARIAANTMLNYRFNANWDVTLSHQYIGSKDYATSAGDEGKIEDYNLTNLVFTYRQKKHQLHLYLKNLFDQDYTYPEPVRQNLKEIPGGPSATAYLSWQYYF